MKRKLNITDRTLQKKVRKIFPYGNMDRYYGYRSIDNPKEVDSRIEVLMKFKQYIEGKNCLDVGCNCGKLTFQIGV
jgi:7SK snRNA methylphosphate capping enzyme